MKVKTETRIGALWVPIRGFFNTSLSVLTFEQEERALPKQRFRTLSARHSLQTLSNGPARASAQTINSEFPQVSLGTSVWFQLLRLNF